MVVTLTLESCEEMGERMMMRLGWQISANGVFCGVKTVQNLSEVSISVS